MSNNTDYITIELPSSGILYNIQEPIQIRTFKGRDEKLIAEITAENAEKKVSTILTNVLKGIDPLELTLGDRLHILLWERINSYGKMYDVRHTCEHCLNISDYSVDLSKLEIVKLPKDFKEPFEERLPVSGEIVKLRLLRVSDMIKLDEMLKQNQNIWLYRYALTIVNDKNVWDNLDYLENLSTKDLLRIRAFQDKYIHGPKLETKYECPNCGGVGAMPIPFRPEILLPQNEVC